MAYRIRKSTGYHEPFSEKKFRKSLHNAGADEKLTNRIIEAINTEKPKSTKQIHELAVTMLQEKHPPVAARYNLKRALMELGPAGFPFEQFVAELFRSQGYKVKTNQTITGYCVDHEVDIIATKGDEHFMVECKFHNKPSLKSDVKVALYIHARFQDLKQAWEKEHTGSHKIHQAWIVSNTHFSSEAVHYGECRNMKVIGWSYPLGENLARMIDRLGLHPITALTTLTKRQKHQLIKHGLVLCRDAKKQSDILKKTGFSKQQIKEIINEMEGVCALS